jgi:hypothetical protein
MDTRATLDLLTDGVLGLLWIASVARVTRLFTVDAITDFIRAWVYGRWGEHSLQGYFSTCPWCVSIWVAFPTAPVLLHYLERDQWALPLVALAASYWAGISATKLETDDDDVEIITED